MKKRATRTLKPVRLNRRTPPTNSEPVLHDAVRHTLESENLRFVGFSESAARGGEMVSIFTREFLTSDDGDVLVQRLDAIYNTIVLRLPEKLRVSPSRIGQLVVVCHRNGKVDVHINASAIVAKVRPSRNAKKGDPVRLDDITEIYSVKLKDVRIPDDAGYAILFSVGWRRALLYDFSMVAAAAGEQVDIVPGDVEGSLAAAYRYLLFRNRWSLSDAEWTSIVAQRWFIFSGLPESIVTRIIAQVRSKWPIDELLEEIVAHVKASLNRVRELMANGPLERHRNLIYQALDAFERDEYQIVTASLFPRIEGILREQLVVSTGSVPDNVKFAELPDVVVPIAGPPPYSLLMPERFRDYLLGVVFAPDDFRDPSTVTRATRHTVGHGVAADQTMTVKDATIAILILQQLALLFTTPQVLATEESAP